MPKRWLAWGRAARLVVTYGEDAEGAQGVGVVSNENVHGAAERLLLEGHVDHCVIDLSDLRQRNQHCSDYLQAQKLRS